MTASPDSIWNPEYEKRMLRRAYRSLLKAGKRELDTADQVLIRKALDTAIEAHSQTRRKSGEPYIFHPIAVAHIVSQEIGLGTTAVVAALLHDVVEDTDLTNNDMELLFGTKVAKIIEGLTKISEVSDMNRSLQAENFRKILVTLSDDVRVILIKIADRLHNMRTLESMASRKQKKIASETLYLYAPLAHRLGLYAIKTELEDLSLKYLEPDIYSEIEQKLQKTKAVRTRFINSFKLPIVRTLNQQGYNFEIQGRTKSIYSIWKKMQTKNIPFEEVYDVFAIRIILHVGYEEEKKACWSVYSIVTDFYRPNPDRLRDWITTPKSNGYESLHTTVMSPGGKWVEVQVRTKRMDEIAEKGLAAHWKYKESAGESNIDLWLNKIRDLLENPTNDAVDFIDDFKLDLFSDEIFVFTPQGEVKTMRKNATALDFAFEIHTQIGARCLGAKVNNKLVPLSYKLKSGDQVEIITSKKQSPKEDWLKFVLTAKARSKIKSLLKEEKKKLADLGKVKLGKKLKSLGLKHVEQNVKAVMNYFKAPNSLELHYGIEKGKFDLRKIRNLKSQNGLITYEPRKKTRSKSIEQIITNIRGKADMLVLGQDMKNIEYKLATCCNPIPGDDVFGFVTVSKGITIHRINCPNALALLSNYAYRVVQAKWMNQESLAFLVGIKITGIDHVGLVNDVTKIISEELNVNMRSLSFDSNDGIFEGRIMAFVNDVNHLTDLMNKLKKVEGVTRVQRIDSSKNS